MRPTANGQPALFHVTQWKAGSQWIHKILRDCVVERIVPPEVDEAQFLRRPLRAGRVYPTVYVTKQQWDSVKLPASWRRFVVVRDPRDILVSGYFSMRSSHPLIAEHWTRWRTAVTAMDDEQGLLYAMDEWLPRSVPIHTSWHAAGVPLIRYEDLLENDVEILERVLLDECELGVPREQLRRAIHANRFERLTGGRPRGQADPNAHERRGVAGDWREHFTDRVKDVFKARYGELLVGTGYETGLDW